MLYRKITVELIVPIEEANSVATELDLMLDRLEEKHTLFGGEIESSEFEHPRISRPSALAHTIAAGSAVGLALRAARKRAERALRAVV